MEGLNGAIVHLEVFALIEEHVGHFVALQHKDLFLILLGTVQNSLHLI